MSGCSQGYKGSKGFWRDSKGLLVSEGFWWDLKDFGGIPRVCWYPKSLGESRVCCYPKGFEGSQEFGGILRVFEGYQRFLRIQGVKRDLRNFLGIMRFF